MNSNMVVHRK